MGHEEDPEVKIPFRIEDHATGIAGKIAHSVEHLGHIVDHVASHLTELGGALTGMAGAFGFEQAIEGGKEYLEQIGKISKLTGTSAQNVAALRDVFEKSDLSADTLSTTLTAISKKTAMAQEGGKGLIAMAQKWGVNMKEGPEATLVSMSKLVAAHKIGAGQVNQILRVSGENLGAMMGLLQKGPAELNDLLGEARKQNRYLTEDSILAFERYKEASVAIHQAWTRISAKIVTALAPVLTKLSDHLSVWMDKLGDHAGKFAEILGRGMEFALDHAKQIGRVMLANAIIMRGSGGAFGVAGGLMRVAKFGAGIGGGLATKVLGATGISGGAAAGQLGGVLGPISGIVTQLMRLAGGATGIGLIVVAVIEIVRHFDAIKTRFLPTVLRIWESLKGIGAQLEKLITTGPLNSMIIGIGEFFATALGGIASLLEAVRIFARVASDFSLGKSFSSQWANAQFSIDQEDTNERLAPMYAKREAYKKLLDSARKGGEATEEERTFYRQYLEMANKAGVADKLPKELARKFGGRAPGEDKAGGAVINQDFRNSRFEIEQKFAEGFDPDRIAAAFANDLGSLGERKLASGFAPLFGIR